MPGRWESVGIVLFWAVMTGWLALREATNYFGAGPTFRDTLAASADQKPVDWRIVANDWPVGRATTQVRHDQKTGAYDLTQIVFIDRLDNVQNALSSFFRIVSKFANTDRVFGDQAALEIDNRVRINFLGQLERLNVGGYVRTGKDQTPVTWHVDARPKGDVLHVRYSLSFMGQPYGDPEQNFYDIPATGGQLVLNGLAPVDRMPGLRPGQAWETRMVDPMSSFLQKALERPPVKVQVLDEPQGLYWDGTLVNCLVVQTKQPDLAVQIWVRQADGVVLKQAAQWGTTRLEVIRAAPKGAPVEEPRRPQ